MPTPVDNAALYAVGSCGCHQQTLAAPLASGNFTNIASSNAVDGVYTLNGSPCAITDIVDLASPDASFDPALDIDAGGVKTRAGSGRTLPIKAPLLADLLADGFSVVFTGTFDAGSTSIEIHCHSADYNTDAYVAVARASYDLNSVDFTEIFNGSGGVSAGLHKFAVTLTNARMALSIDGGAVVSQESPAINGAVVAIQFGMGGDSGARLRSFIFYGVVDDADLPTLSAL